MKLRESEAWGVIATALEDRLTACSYDPYPQHSLCRSVSTLFRMGQITRHTCWVMTLRIRLFAPYSDSSTKALYWNRFFNAPRQQRILAAWFLHHMSKGGS